MKIYLTKRSGFVRKVGDKKFCKNTLFGLKRRKNLVFKTLLELPNRKLLSLSTLSQLHCHGGKGENTEKTVTYKLHTNYKQITYKLHTNQIQKLSILLEAKIG